MRCNKYTRNAHQINLLQLQHLESDFPTSCCQQVINNNNFLASKTCIFLHLKDALQAQHQENLRILIN